VTACSPDKGGEQLHSRMASASAISFFSYHVERDVFSRLESITTVSRLSMRTLLRALCAARKPGERLRYAGDVECRCGTTPVR